MIEQVNGFITPMKGWDAVEKNDKKNNRNRKWHKISVPVSA